MKRLIALLLSICAIASIAAVPASASNAMQVDYNLESSYEVLIPSSINLNQENTVSIYAERVLIGDGKELIVKLLDGAMNGDNYIYLYHEGYEVETQRIGCYVFTGDYGASFPYGWQSASFTNYVVARFKNGETSAYVGGSMYIEPQLIQTSLLGQYSGRVEFTFSIEDLLSD